MEIELELDELELIINIVERASKLNIIEHSKETLTLDIVIADKEFDLRLEQLLNADDFNFAHDIVGIQNNIDRANMRMAGIFVPRYASSEKEVG